MENLEKKQIIDDLEEKSNNEILFEIKQMEADHEALKLKMIKDYDKLVEIEKKFDRANKILVKRLKGE
jgi:replicative DNA helicase